MNRSTLMHNIFIVYCRRFSRLINCLVMLLLTFHTMAQPDDNGGEPVSSDVPIDGGISILAIGAMAYGVRRFHRVKKDKINKSPIFSK